MDGKLNVVCPHCAAVNRVPSARLADGPACGRCKDVLFAGAPASVDEQGFARHVAESDIPVLVDFWAPWCGPCVSMAPAYTEAAAELEPAMRVLKVNTEEAPQLSARLNIRSIPTLAVFKGGKEVARTAGALSRQQLVQFARTSAGPL
jgi:thioredoxin 2